MVLRIFRKQYSLRQANTNTVWLYYITNSCQGQRLKAIIIADYLPIALELAMYK